MMLTVDYDYTRALDGSLHHSWTVDDVFKGRTFDFTKRFLPERIAGVESIACLDGDEKLKLNQIRGNSYCHLFAFVEEYIVPMVLENATRDVYGDETRLWSLLRFAEEEVKHQEMMRRACDQFAEGFGTPCELVGGREAVAQAVLEHLAPRRAACSRARSSGLSSSTTSSTSATTNSSTHCSATCSSITGSTSHGTPSSTRSLSPRSRPKPRRPSSRARSTRSFSSGWRSTGCSRSSSSSTSTRSSEPPRARSLRTSATRSASRNSASYRWTFLVSGLEHPKFLEVVDAVTRDGRAKVDAAAEALSA